MSAHAHGDEKQNANSTNKKEPENPTYKVQPLHAAVLLQSGSNCLRSLVAELVAVLQNSCRPMRAAMKNKTRIQQIKHNESHKVQNLQSCEKRNRSAIHSRNVTKARIDHHRAVNVEFPLA